ncbi:Uncharacterized protein TCM_045265 [Theobroma cacao]|uniref:Uncharacterized protein n=1 Tax=Theobroma cacao TaxID=3641 RepID=A0A061FT31_THECC|nr:Uncharacterized protein TCM_045265 [Theobroma cacao]
MYMDFREYKNVKVKQMEVSVMVSPTEEEVKANIPVIAVSPKKEEETEEQDIPKGYCCAGLMQNIMVRQINEPESQGHELRFEIGKTNAQSSKQEFCLVTGLKFGRLPNIFLRSYELGGRKRGRSKGQSKGRKGKKEIEKEKGEEKVVNESLTDSDVINQNNII